MSRVLTHEVGTRQNAAAARSAFAVGCWWRAAAADKSWKRVCGTFMKADVLERDTM
jgi:hypothetical protein